MSILRLKETFLSWARRLILLFIRPRVLQGGDRQPLGQSDKEELGGHSFRACCRGIYDGTGMCQLNERQAHL